jgi:hypothetical protein
MRAMLQRNGVRAVPAVLLLFISTIIVPIVEQSVITDIRYRGAGVLPIYLDEEGDLCVVLGRERQGMSRGLYDLFGGRRDKGEHDPTQTAARECFEELVSQQTTGMSKEVLEDYVRENRTAVVVSERKKYVIFVVRFDQYIERIKKTFSCAIRDKKQKREYREKDRIAFAKLCDIKKVVESGSFAKVPALVQEWDSGEGRFALKQKKIRLRPIFFYMMRLYFKEDAQLLGKDSKVHTH